VNGPEDQLLAALELAHSQAARGPCASSAAFSLAAGGSGDFGKALIAAISTLGGKHGPITGARQVIYRGAWPGIPVPGWGNSFYRKGDPSFFPVEEFLKVHYLGHWDLLTDQTFQVRTNTGKPHLVPNAAAYTAVVAQILDMDLGTELALFVRCRLSAWAKLFKENNG